MQIFIKAALSAGIVVAATAVAKRFPSLAGLIGVMPLTGALVLAWVYVENAGDPRILQGFAKGALWGLVPSVLFYVAAFLCLKRELPLAGVLGAGFAAWLAAALVQQWALK